VHIYNIIIIYICMSVRSYNAVRCQVDAVEQKGIVCNMVDSGARGAKDRNPRTEVDCKSIVPIN
jgi:hypothetical protein